MKQVIVRCVPRVYYWLIGIFLYPIAAFVFTAVLIRGGFLLLGSNLSGRPLILTWLSVTAIVALWAYTRDYRRLSYALLPDSLLIGRGGSAIRVHFGEIQSIVLALPERLPWWLRIQRFNPKGRAAYRSVIQARQLTILLRLSGRRYLPLNLAYTFLTNGPGLMAEFLRRNQHKIVGHDSYTEREIAALASARSNTLMTL
jgi:hypothetical protein